ncbi:hypothetical protein U1Q18_032415 [Sarracenia purpurea var. burkii]
MNPSSLDDAGTPGHRLAPRPCTLTALIPLRCNLSRHPLTPKFQRRNGEEQALKVTSEEKFQRQNGEEQAMKVTSEGGRGRGRGTYRGRGRGRADFNKATVECYRCH